VCLDSLDLKRLYVGLRIALEWHVVGLRQFELFHDGCAKRNPIAVVADVPVHTHDFVVFLVVGLEFAAVEDTAHPADVPHGLRIVGELPFASNRVPDPWFFACASLHHHPLVGALRALTQCHLSFEGERQQQ
jgi:hypothetical protein